MGDHSAPDVANRKIVDTRVFRIAFAHVSGPRFRLIATLAEALRLAPRI